MLTYKDFQEVETLVRKVVKEETKHLPSLEHFDQRMDTLSGEIKKVRDEQIVHSGDHSEIDNRFERVDTHLGVSTAA